MKINLGKFQKVSGDVHHSILRDPKGHEIKVLHKPLSPKFRSDLIAMPSMTAKPAAEGAKTEAPTKTPAKAAMDKPAYFGGGRVKPAPAPAEDMDDDEKSMVEKIHQTGTSVAAKDFNNPFVPKKPVEKKAEGGSVGESAACAVQRSMGNPCEPPKDVRIDDPSMKKYAEGGDVQAAAQPQAPVNIYVGGNAPQGAMGPTGVPAQAEAAAPPAPTQDAAPGMTGATGPQAAAMQPPGMTGVTEPSGSIPPQMAQDGPKGPTAPPVLPMTDNASGATPEGLAAAQAAPVIAEAAKPPTGPNDPYGTEAYYGSLAKGINNQKLGLQGQAQAAAQQGEQEAKTLEQAAATQATLMQNYNSHFAELDKERQALAHDVSNQHIDPNQFWTSKSTGGKIATLVGMLIGGLGGNNIPALVQQHIDRDIDAQKAELGKKENLLSANMRQFGNLKDATAMTNVMQSEVIKSQLQKAAALAKGPAEKARALQGIGLIDSNNAQALGQIAMRRTLMQGMKSGHIAPEQVIRMIVPEGEKQAAYKELQEGQNLVSTRDRLMAAYDEIAKLNTMVNRATSPVQSSRRIEALKAAVIPGLSKDTAGRYTEQDAGTIEQLFSKMGNSQETIDKNRQELLKLSSGKLHFPMLNAYGIDIGSQGRYTGQTGRSRIPESAPVLKR